MPGLVIFSGGSTSLGWTCQHYGNGELSDPKKMSPRCHGSSMD